MQLNTQYQALPQMNEKYETIKLGKMKAYSA
jgi:hypothetical protein